MLRANTQPDGRFFTAFVYMFAMVMTYEIMWDIRDVAGDAKAGLRTLPVVLGINSARFYAAITSTILPWHYHQRPCERPLDTRMVALPSSKHNAFDVDHLFPAADQIQTAGYLPACISGVAFSARDVHGRLARFALFGISGSLLQLVSCEDLNCPFRIQLFKTYFRIASSAIGR